MAMAQETEALTLPRDTVSAGVRHTMEKPGYGFYIVAEKDGCVIGMLMVTSEWSDWRNAHFWWIQSVYVLPEFRRQGVYRGLYESVKVRAADAGNVCGFRLYVEKSNSVAQKTYESLGMSETHYAMYEEPI